MEDTRHTATTALPCSRTQFSLHRADQCGHTGYLWQHLSQRQPMLPIEFDSIGLFRRYGAGHAMLPILLLGDRAILLNIRSQTVRCPSNLQEGYADVSKLRGYKGVIICPAATVLCPNPFAPTPAPTPAPPTPVPTPAPPGYTLHLPQCSARRRYGTTTICRLPAPTELPALRMPRSCSLSAVRWQSARLFRYRLQQRYGQLAGLQRLHRAMQTAILTGG